ncbi:hypothetical protein [Reichenbachiella sp. MALMAid0571]|uniref:hypothetical protein n=1 Tax=Reichenbachiella sp. MALMAid0571 TaxID=3143939 RepID=UPI0032E04D0B
MSNQIIHRTFKSPIGQVKCGLTIDSTNIETVETEDYENGKSVTFETSGHKIELIEFKIRQPLNNGETVADSKGWIWRINKIQHSDEKLQLSCVLTDYQDNVTFDIATGEHLDAIEANNDDWTLHIGTEDGEMLNTRADSNDWFPARLKNKTDFYQSITRMVKEGFETEIPDLKIGKKIHIQYLTAYDKQNTESVNTWLAVDEFKGKLEKWIGI